MRNLFLKRVFSLFHDHSVVFVVAVVVSLASWRGLVSCLGAAWMVFLLRLMRRLCCVAVCWLRGLGGRVLGWHLLLGVR